MYDGRAILTGLVIFLVLITFPIWYNVGKTAAAPEISLDTPVIRQLATKECVEGTSFMRARHKQLLENWRTWAIRDGQRIYSSSNGKEYEISLELTCLKCHSNKEQFCDRCHSTAAVKPDCWNCHIVPQGR